MRRRSTFPRKRSRASDGPTSESTSAVGTHFFEIEEAIAEIVKTLDIQFHRMAAMQAQLDHLTAKRNDQ